jgi:sulfur-carrier protein
MHITVEFYGIPRQRAGCSRQELEFPSKRIELQEVLRRLTDLHPGLRDECIRDGFLVPGYTANLAGERFLSDPCYILGDGDVLLILSADAGG